jgi:putative mycofactocin binding protein MftB
MVCAVSIESVQPFLPGCAYELRPDVALRPEPFGALAYDYRTRRLTFVRSRLLCALLQSLARFPSAQEAVEALTLSPLARQRLLSGLETLVSSEIVRAR